MSLFKALISLMIALPEILKLINNIKKAADDDAKIARVKQDIEKINQAFETKDAGKLNEIFNS